MNSAILDDMLRPASLWISDDLIICLDKVLACRWHGDPQVLTVVSDNGELIADLNDATGQNFVRALVAYYVVRPQ